MLNFSALSMLWPSSGSQNEHFECLFIILGPTEAKLFIYMTNILED